MNLKTFPNDVSRVLDAATKNKDLGGLAILPQVTNSAECVNFLLDFYNKNKPEEAEIIEPTK